MSREKDLIPQLAGNTLLNVAFLETRAHCWLSLWISYFGILGSKKSLWFSKDNQLFSFQLPVFVSSKHTAGTCLSES